MGGYPVKRICALLLTALILCGCAKIDDTPAVETATPAETVPAATVPSDGDPKNVTCKGSYTGQGKEQTVIASVGKRTLTNGQLAAWYWAEAAQYQGAGRTGSGGPAGHSALRRG